MIRKTSLVTVLFLVTACSLAQAQRKIHVLYVGDSSLTAGTGSAISNFAYDQRGVGVEINAQKILDAWRKKAAVRSQLSHRLGRAGQISRNA